MTVLELKSIAGIVVHASIQRSSQHANLPRSVDSLIPGSVACCQGVCQEDLKGVQGAQLQRAKLCCCSTKAAPSASGCLHPCHWPEWNDPLASNRWLHAVHGPPPVKVSKKDDTLIFLAGHARLGTRAQNNQVTQPRSCLLLAPRGFFISWWIASPSLVVPAQPIYSIIANAEKKWGFRVAQGQSKARGSSEMEQPGWLLLILKSETFGFFFCNFCDNFTWHFALRKL